MEQNRTILAVDSDNFTDIAIRYTQNAENAFLLADLNGMNVDDIIPSGTVIMLPAESETPSTIATKQITEVEPTPAALLELLKQHAGTVATTQQLGHVRSGSQIRVNPDGTMEVVGGVGGVVGQDGLSAYEIWLQEGNTGTEQDFLDSLKGEDGTIGIDGKSAYEIWLDEGNTGTEQDFLDSLQGIDGQQGLSAYEIWLQAGNEGTEEDYLDSLQGSEGQDGAAEIALQVILDKDNWVSNEQTVSAVGVTATNSLVITADTNDVTFNNYYFAGVRPISQSVDSVTFKCSIIPTVDLTANILIL